ncbi:hypothetical protein C4J85_2135 [Pseudomonas sp. R4-34-07]|nr:hypothetical protein C4J88_2174 [Pseudomonas sp. R4-39-08]AZF52620.1 hypothetical protein C4J85_2135 [Pseudomonas sp. R4-34-07]
MSSQKLIQIVAWQAASYNFSEGIDIEIMALLTIRLSFKCVFLNAE